MDLPEPEVAWTDTETSSAHQEYICFYLLQGSDRGATLQGPRRGRGW